MHSIGIVGVGDLTEKVVIGLRTSGYEGAILLSPRNAEKARVLAQQHRCEVMETNQAVVDGADVVFIGVRPEQVAALAGDVTLRPEQPVLSLLAGVKTHDLSTLFPQARCLRLMLSYAAQYNHSTVVIHPPAPTLHPLLERLGTLVPVEDEAAFEVATVAACMNGWVYFLAHGLQQWLVEQGLDPAQARTLALSNVQDCIVSAQHRPDASLKSMGEAIATPGTYTAAGLEVLESKGAVSAWKEACEHVLNRLLQQQRQ
ncbi:NAD(P)-binding domain-containing protein [Pseudomonas sp. RP23018S]|uniref:NAD(P)-binding domain-containing protein n=1 Tax=Pseudomonas sp. RP23018S TaxID=3096037 RepID=UPI002ACA202D|nr:NAD(P)-binding domain-containing protein [Pseudomonas sp. RP23018S]MDZ5602006.1 NAD(P)-binding domain-containing protein [Pseudomonas sp. RP23018S]